MSTADLQNLVNRLEAVTGRLESISVGKGGGSSAVVNDDPEWYDDYKVLKDGTMSHFIKISKALGGDVAKHAELIQAAFHAHDGLMLVAARFNQPKPADLEGVLKPLSGAIIAVQDFREKNRGSKQFNFLSAISEGIPFLGWVAVAPKPANYITQMLESSQFYTNKILKDFREKEPTLADWSNHWIKLLKDIQAYVKDTHTIGLAWNKEKPAATAALAASVSCVAPTLPGGAPPLPPAGPPPPPAGAPPPPAPGAASSKPKSEPVDSSALMAAISKGSDVTKGLKKVTADQQTHKNPALRSQEPVKSNALAPRPFKKVTPPGTKTVAKKPPIFELQGKKWVIENQDGNQNLIIESGETQHVVYMYKCTNSVLQVKNKINSITLDGCKKCGVVFEDLISTCEFVNCTSVKAQASGSVPTISIDKTDGAQIYVNEKSIKTQIITAKSSEMNVCITKADGDLSEYPLAEQFKTEWDGKKFVTVPMDLNL